MILLVAGAVIVLFLLAVCLKGLGGQCPDCGTELSFDHHGYGQKYGHCPNPECGYCPYCG